MTIETKFDKGDLIFFIENRKCCSSIIRRIKIDVSLLFTEIIYLCNSDNNGTVYIKVSEINAFKSKDELLKSL